MHLSKANLISFQKNGREIGNCAIILVVSLSEALAVLVVVQSMWKSKLPTSSGGGRTRDGPCEFSLLPASRTCTYSV